MFRQIGYSVADIRDNRVTLVDLNRVLQKYVWSALMRSKITGGQADHIFVRSF